MPLYSTDIYRVLVNSCCTTVVSSTQTYLFTAYDHYLRVQALAPFTLLCDATASVTYKSMLCRLLARLHINYFPLLVYVCK
jgi:hypothetical protein